MPLSFDEINKLEVREDYPAALDALEARIHADPSDREAVIRLGFNLWYVVAEAMRMQKRLPTEQYAKRFMEVFHAYRPQFEGDADFCWAFGQAISLSWFELPGADEALREALVARAKELDQFYERFFRETGYAEMVERFRGRGIFAKYYGITPTNGAKAG